MWNHFRKPVNRADHRDGEGARPVLVQHLLWSLERAGAELLLLSLVRHSAAAFRHAVCCLGPDGPLRAQFEEAGCHVDVVGRGRARGSLRVLLGAAAGIRAQAPDIVHLHRCGPDIWGQVAAALAGHGCVVATEHGPYVRDADGSPQFSSLKTSLRRALRSQLRWTIAISHAVARNLLRNRLVAPARLQVVHNGVDTQVYAPAPSGRAAGPVVGAAGRLISRKGFDVLLEAFAATRRVFPGAAMILAGTGPEQARLADQIEKLGLGSAVVMRGEVEDMPAFFRSLDVFVMPSLSEGFGMSLLEAMSCGLPVIASDVDGMRELVQHGKSGLLVEPGNPAPLGAAIEHVVRDHDLLARLGECARGTAVEQFSIQRMVRLYERTYRDALCAARRGRVGELAPFAIPKRSADVKAQGVLLLVDYRGRLNISTRHKDAGMDLVLLGECFRDLGYDLEARDYASLNLRNESFKGQPVLYQSSEDRDLHYKGYIEDVLLGLHLQGALLLPDFPKFRAHHDKVFMEMLRNTSGCPELQTVQSATFGTWEDYLRHESALRPPVVLKPAAGAMSTDVTLARDPAEMRRFARRLSSSFSLVDALKNEAKAILRPLYDRQSNHRRKFVVQDFVPGLKNDFKVLVFGDRYYALLRRNRPGDFRASGSGLFEWPDSPPPGLLDTARRVFAFFDVPFLSLDMGFDGSRFHVFEFQFVQFGPYTLEQSPFRFERRGEQWVKVQGRSVLEEEYARSIVAYLRKHGDPRPSP